MCGQDNPDDPIDDDIAGALRDGLVEEGKTWVRWALGGAVVGAIVLGGVGACFARLTGFGVGALIGAALGGVGAWLFYLQG